MITKLLGNPSAISMKFSVMLINIITNCKPVKWLRDQMFLLPSLTVLVGSMGCK